VKSRVEHLLPIVLMLLLGGLTLWLRQLIEAPQAAAPRRVSHEAIATVERFTVTQLDTQGVPEYRLSAEKMLHFADDRTTELVEPRLVRTRADSTITVIAERGRVDHDYKQAHFYDNVQLVRALPGKVDDLRVRTEYLHVIPEQDLAKTDRRVIINEGPSRLSGTGMEYNRRTGQLILHSDVKGTFDGKKK
jgi:lipopolysaccharide export system protein LptC